MTTIGDRAYTMHVNLIPEFLTTDRTNRFVEDYKLHEALVAALPTDDPNAELSRCPNGIGPNVKISGPGVTDDSRKGQVSQCDPPLCDRLLSVSLQLAQGLKRRAFGILPRPN